MTYYAAFARAITCDATNSRKCSRHVRRIESCKLNSAPVVLNTKNCLHKLASSLNCSAVSNQNRKRKPFEVDRTARAARRSKLRTVKQVNVQEHNGEKITRKNEYQTSQDDAETRQVLVEAAQSFIETIEFYKKDFGEPMSHDEAVKETLRIYEGRRQRVAGLQPQESNLGTHRGSC